MYLGIGGNRMMEVMCLNCLSYSNNECLIKGEDVDVSKQRVCLDFETRHGYPLTLEELEDAKEEALCAVQQGEHSFQRCLNTAQDFEDLLIDLKESYNVEHLDDVTIEFRNELDGNDWYTIYYPRELDFDTEFQRIKYDMMIKKANRYKEFQRLSKEFGGKE